MKFRSWRDDEGWPTPPTTSEGSTPDPPPPIRDIPAERYIVEPDRARHLRIVAAVSAILNGGLLLALAAVAWYAAENRP